MLGMVPHCSVMFYVAQCLGSLHQPLAAAAAAAQHPQLIANQLHACRLALKSVIKWVKMPQ